MNKRILLSTECKSNQTLSRTVAALVSSDRLPYIVVYSSKREPDTKRGIAEILFFIYGHWSIINKEFPHNMNGK